MERSFFGPRYPIKKMHGTGNDFVFYVDFDERTTPIIVKKICSIHTGVGADGVITITKSRIPQAKYRMKYFNADGSLAEMCGNGIRCFAKYLLDNKLISSKRLAVDTDIGLLSLEILSNTKNEAIVQVNMGKPVLFNAKQVSKKADKNGFVSFKYSLRHKEKQVKLDGTYVSMGNPHAVFFVPKGKAGKYAKEFGPQIEIDTKNFPQKTNVEFVEINNKKELTLHVWERGSGLTLSCGTGVCAALVAGVIRKNVEKSVKVHVPGGILKVSWDGKDSPVYLTGPAENVFTVTNLNL